ncbi:hypothetical protein ABK040_002301 [Willaertia magna]
MYPSRENSTDYEKNIKLLVYTVERAIDSMPEGVEQMCWVIDFNGYSTRNAPPFSVAKQTLSILNDCYPERLGSALLVDTPFIFNIFWRAISPFINPVTKAKINFVKGNDTEKAKQFSKFMDVAHLEKHFGGESDFVYNHQEFWQNEIELDVIRLKRLGISVTNKAEEKKEFALTEEDKKLMLEASQQESQTV